MTDAMRRWSFFNAELTRSTLVDDGSADRLVGAVRGLDHVPCVGGRDLDGFECAADGVLVRGAALGAFLLHHPDLHLDDFEGVVQLHVTDIVGFAAVTDKARAVLGAVAAGKIPPDLGAQLVAAIGSVARLAEVDELVRRVSALEAAGHESEVG